MSNINTNSNETHTHSWTPYNGHNPNNCTHCGQSSSNWKFTPLDEFADTHSFCNDCISRGVLFEKGIKGKDIDKLTRFNH